MCQPGQISCVTNSPLHQEASWLQAVVSSYSSQSWGIFGETLPHLSLRSPLYFVPAWASFRSSVGMGAGQEEGQDHTGAQVRLGKVL